MILAKSALRQAVEKKELQFLDDTGIILPEWFGVSMGHLGEDPIALQPASVDLCLGNEWAVPLPNYTWGLGKESSRTRCVHPKYYGDRVCDSRTPIEYKREESASFMIPAHGFVLARTKEVISISENLFGKVEGRSSVGRTGLIVETAGVIDPGFMGLSPWSFSTVSPIPYWCTLESVFARSLSPTSTDPRRVDTSQISTKGKLEQRDPSCTWTSPNE